jgi:diguanylate cyclase (GGDEF)-like protein
VAGTDDEDTRAASLAVAPSTLAWDQPTVRLGPGRVALLQSLGDPATRTACLVLYSGDEPGQRHPLREGTLRLGRAPDCELPLDSPGISRRHAELQVTGDSVRLRDLGSVNGTHVNDVRVHDSVELRDGDLLRLGDVLLKFYPRHSLDALLHDHIYRLATVDTVTEVYTRRYVLDALAREIRRTRRSDRALAVVGLDLDHFKSVNDRWGHDAGDQVLHAAAATVQQALRGSDILGRMGGEEFLAVLPDTPRAEALALAERLRAALAGRTLALRQPDGSELPHRQTASLGVAVLTPEMSGSRELLAAADARLYEAKHAGRNRVSG